MAVNDSTRSFTFYWNQAATPKDPTTGKDITTPSGYWPDVGVPVMDINQLTTSRVKRVVAMTRKPGVHWQPQYDDGAFMFAAVSACAWNRYYQDDAGKYNFNTQPWSYQTNVPGVARQVTVVDENGQGPNSDQTGFDAPANGSLYAKDLLDKSGNPTPSSSQYGGGSHWRVNFRYLDCWTSGAPLSDAQNEAIARSGSDPRSFTAVAVGTTFSRYNQEYVEIWLRKGAFGSGQRVKHRPQLKTR